MGVGEVHGLRGKPVFAEKREGALFLGYNYTICYSVHLGMFPRADTMSRMSEGLIEYYSIPESGIVCCAGQQASNRA